MAADGMPGSIALPDAVALDEADSRPERASLIGFVQDAETEAALREGLRGTRHSAPDIRRASIQKAIQTLQQGEPPSTLVVDMAGEDEPLAVLGDLAQAVEPSVTVFVIGDRQDLDFYRRITRGLGVREYLFKPLTAEMVARHFGAALDGRTDPDMVIRGGRVIAVVGARAGAGASTIAANLAWHLGEQAKRRSVLVDLDLHTGVSAMMLGLQPTPAFCNALEAPERIDELYLERAVQAVGPRLDVLASEHPLDDTVRYAGGAVTRVISLLQRRYNFIVLDLPISQSEIVRDVREAIHQSVVVLDPSLPAIRDTIRFLAVPRGPRHASRPLVVLNRTGASGSLGLAQVTEALQSAPDIVIPELGRALREAELSGKPAVAATRALQDGVAEIARRAAGVKPPDPQRRLLLKILR